MNCAKVLNLKIVNIVNIAKNVFDANLKSNNVCSMNSILQSFTMYWIRPKGSVKYAEYSDSAES